MWFQVLDPLRAMITGAPLEDARHLAQRYSRMRQEAEAQVSKKLGLLYICSFLYWMWDYCILVASYVG